MSLRIHRVIPVLGALLFLGALPASAAEPEQAPGAPISVAIAATSADGPSGVGLLATTEAGTGVQVLVTGAAPGTNVAIHGQACSAIDGTALVGLVGAVASAGQVQSTIPNALSTLTDGTHVIALHPGLDFGDVVACGVIPLVTGPNQVPQPPVDDTCTGVPAWVDTARARLTRIQELETLANNAQLQGIPAYVAQLSTNIGEARAMANMARGETAPPGAAAEHAAFIDMLESLAIAASDLQFSMGGQDPVAVQRALASLSAATQKLIQVRTSVTELDVRCPG
jgi:hypothetical protein